MESKPLLDSPLDGPLPQSKPREPLVSTAVKFLQNPKVRPSTLDQKRLFLKKKGLTDEEVQEACEQAGAHVDEQQRLAAQSLQHTLVPIPSESVQPVSFVPSTWLKIRDYCNAALVIGGAAYGLYYLYQKYIAPYLFNKTKKKEKSVEEMMEEMNTSVFHMLQQLHDTLQTLQSVLTKQQGKLEELSQHQKLGAGTKELLQELKTELSSVKGLLLNRRQFPAVPAPSPAIPSWQLEHKIKNSVKHSFEKEDKAETPTPDITAATAERASVTSDEAEPRMSHSEGSYSDAHASKESSNGVNSNGSIELVMVNEPSSDGSDISEEAVKELCRESSDQNPDVQRHT